MAVSAKPGAIPARRSVAPDVHPDPNSPAYRATEFRHPKQPLIIIPQTLTELTAPVYGHDAIAPTDHDLTVQHAAPPLGQRIIVTGRVLDEDDRPVPNTLIEVWQANAAGRYAHKIDRWDAPLDANFTGAGRALSDVEGRYRFITSRPGAYPWRNHDNAWRPAHIHFSLFGQAFATRLVTQMYFPGDPLLPFDPIFNSVPEGARHRMVSAFDLSITTPEWALGFQFDIVLRGRAATPMER